MPPSPQFSLVLSGGGLKGLAHIGVLRALEESGLVPNLVAGTSIGALIAAAWATGMELREMEDRALAITRKDLFRIAHLDMALKRMHSPAVYRPEPLDTLIHSLVGDRRFSELPRRLLVNTADLTTGQQLLWGLPGLQDARVADAVFASCALPGLFPPRTVMGHLCVDGAVVENMPVRVASMVGEGPVLAVDVGGSGAERPGVGRQGFAATYARGLEIVMQTMVEFGLREWQRPPMVLIRPNVQKVSMFTFNQTPFLMAEGYRVTLSTLSKLPTTLDHLGAGIYPLRRVRVSVDQARCVGCGVCAARAPKSFGMDDLGKARVLQEEQTWSPLGGRVVLACPVRAIGVAPLTPDEDTLR